jgi:hypothetical protein
MIRTLFLAISLLAAAVVPNPAHGWARGPGGHGHHHGHHRFHHFSSFVFVYDPFLYYPYPYYYPYPVYSLPDVVEPPPVAYQPPAVQREVIYPNGKYVLYGDGVKQPYQWVWIPAAPPPPSPPQSD